MTDTLPTLDSNPSEQPIAFDARTRRVLELRKQVREGTYVLDAREVATAILAEWLAAPELDAGEQSAPSIDSAAGRRTVGARFVVAKSEPEAVAVATARTA